MKQIKSFQLKTSCIRNVPLNCYDEFKFIVNGEEFKTSRLISDLISPRISKIHHNDPTINEYIINTENSGDFSKILQFVKFEQEQIEEKEIPFVLEILNQLGNENEYLFIEEEETQLNEDNIFNIYKTHTKYRNIYHKSIDEEIKFISSHFSELLIKHEEEMTEFSINTLSLIMNNDNFQINNEDEVLNFINKLYSNDCKYSILYENILFENVSQESMNDFISIFDVNDINLNTWKQLSKRLSKEIKNKQTDNNIYNKSKTRYKTNNKNEDENEERYKIITKTHNEGEEFNGIFQYLTTENGSNIAKNGTINITSNSIVNENESYQPKNLVDYQKNESNYYYHSKSDIVNGYVCFYFKDKQIQLTSYSIKSYNGGPNWYNLKNWNIEVSNDGENWTSIDEHRNDSSLNGARIIKTFNIQQKTGFYRYLRLHQTGKNWYGNYYMIFYSFEIYGQLKQPIFK